MTKKVLISTYPFCINDSLPIELLKKENYQFDLNSLDRKLTSEDLEKIIAPYDALIAGTENINEQVLNAAKNLKIISRVGIGLDSIDIQTAKKKNITITYTPDAPTKAVSELTIGLMLNLARQITTADKNMKNNKWQRIQGIRLENKTIGIIGVGRIGKHLIQLLQSFNAPIIANDIEPDLEFGKKYNITWVTKKKIYKKADIISLHIPLTDLTKNLITDEKLSQMQNHTMLINTSRGGIINENDLFHALKNNIIHSAAIDVFEQEPYTGPLQKLDNIILTPHMGSCSMDCRARMEIEATQTVINFFKNQDISKFIVN